MNLEQVKEQLEARKQALLTRADKVERDASHRDEAVSADFAEQATERENDDVLRTIGIEARHELRLIEHALERLATDHYYECAECGADIGEARLIAVPYTEHCIQCATKLEQAH